MALRRRGKARAGEVAGGRASDALDRDLRAAAEREARSLEAQVGAGGGPGSVLDCHLGVFIRIRIAIQSRVDNVGYIGYILIALF